MIFASFYLYLIGLARIVTNTKPLEELGCNQVNQSIGFPFSSKYSGASQAGTVSPLGDIWQHMEIFLLVTTGAVLLASTAQRSGMLLNSHVHKSPPTAPSHPGNTELSGLKWQWSKDRKTLIFSNQSNNLYILGQGHFHKASRSGGWRSQGRVTDMECLTQLKMKIKSTNFQDRFRLNEVLITDFEKEPGGNYRLG